MPPSPCGRGEWCGPLLKGGVLSAKIPIAKNRNIGKISLIVLFLPANLALFSVFKVDREQKSFISVFIQCG
jgi:hypothetical protein